MGNYLLIKMLKCKTAFLLVLTLFVGQALFAQGSHTISGVVTESDGATSLPGVNIVEKGTSNGTISDLDGKFTLKVSDENAVILFSFMGFETQEVAVGGQTTFNVEMLESANELEEVVAIGYGTVRKKDITGSVSSVKAEDLTSVPSSTAAEALTGKMAGVNVVTTEGSPDAEVKIRIRGGGSISQDNSPLYIVDGFPVSSISDIPSSEIQTIDVLKDASSTAIYGSRGANGVIIITTKGGKAGKVKVSYNAYMGYKKAASTLNMLGVKDYVSFQYEKALLDGSEGDLERYENLFGNYQDIDLYEGQEEIDWFEQVAGRTGTTFNQDLTVSGGTEKFTYSLGYAGRNSKEIMLGSDYKRDNVSLKLQNKPNDKVKIDFSFRYSDDQINGGGGIEQSGASPTDARVKQAMTYLPLPFKDLGDLKDDDLKNQLKHPIVTIDDNDRQQHRTRYNMGTSFSWKILDELELKIAGGINYYTRDDDRFRGLTTYYVSNTPSAEYQGDPAVQSWRRKSVSYRNANTLNYDFKKIFGGNMDHKLNLLVGQEIVKTQSSTIYNEVWGLPEFFDAETAFNIISEGHSNFYSNVINPDDKLLSFFGRANYSFKGKYLFSATYRADGSSRFGDGNKWGYFPSAAVAWRISEESFMDGTENVLSDLKLRVSYGTAGNNNIPANQISQVYSSQATTRISGINTYWAPAMQMANPDLKWETTYTRNIGLDFGFLNNRISGSAEIYLNTTEDLLFLFPTPGSGYDNQYRNTGNTENRGVEVALNIVAVDKENFGLNIGFNIGMNENEITSLGVMEDYGASSNWASTEILNDYWIAEGKAVGLMRGYVSDGRYEVSDFSGYDQATDTWTLNPGVSDNSTLINTDLRPGSMKLKDLDGNGVVDVDDQTIIGDANPVSTGGITLNARVYGFDLTAAFSWSYGQDVYNANKVEFTTARFNFFNLLEDMETGKRWTNLDASTGEIVNDPTTLAQLNENTTMWSPYMGRRVFSDWAVEDGSFLRLNTLSLGYTLPGSILNKVKIDRLRVYTTVSNVFILTNYSGFDPEVSTRRNSPFTPNVDYSAYPKSRQLLFGVNLTF